MSKITSRLLFYFSWAFIALLHSKSLAQGALSESFLKPRLDASVSVAAVIVKYKANGAWSRAPSDQPHQTPAPQHAQKINQALGLNSKDGRVLDTYIQSLRATGISSSELVKRLSTLPDVEWVEVDQIKRIHAIPNDPYLANNLQQVTPTVGQWYLRSPNANTPSAIDAVGAWEITTGSPNVVVGVLDSGVRLDHPDLQGKLLRGYDFISDSFTGNDGNGRDSSANDPGSWSLDNMCAPGEPGERSSWHGTQVAGLIGAATNNALGIAGVGYNTRILPVRVLGRCGGYDSDIIAGMLWAAGLGTTQASPNPHPAKILNLSLGGQGPCSNAYKATIQRLTSAQVAIVVAAGNDYSAVATPGNCPGVITVAALRHLGTKADYSNFGSQVSIAAPGGNCVNPYYVEECLYPIMSTTNWGDTTPGANGYSDSYQRTGVGTSFAAPLVAGTIGLMLALQPQLSLKEIKTNLLATATPFPVNARNDSVETCVQPSDQMPFQGICICTRNTCGAGMLNTQAAVSAIAPPSVTITPSAIQGRKGGYITLNSTGTRALGSKSVAAYTWSIVLGNGLAGFVGVRNGSMATLALKKTGNVLIALTVTDSQKYTTTRLVTLNITP